MLEFVHVWHEGGLALTVTPIRSPTPSSCSESTAEWNLGQEEETTMAGSFCSSQYGVCIPSVIIPSYSDKIAVQEYGVQHSFWQLFGVRVGLGWERKHFILFRAALFSALPNHQHDSISMIVFVTKFAR